MADGNYIIDTKIDSSDLNKDLKKAAREFDDFADEAKESNRDIQKSFDKVADKAEDVGKTIESSFDDAFGKFTGANIFADLAADALQNIGDAALDVAKQSIEAAADIKAENAQFEQTFKGVEKTARDALEGIADETGITATRMQKSYTSIYAFTKSIGAQTGDALDISSRAMLAAADSAAYYDVSIEEATETLQSFLKGNYENDAALGIAATETTRNAKANELYAKSFDKLTESQKVDVLLAMVEAGNEASGALGQAAREADSWTNILGELQELWRQLLGVIGSPIIENLGPFIQNITESLKKLVETTASENLAEGMETFQQAIDGIDAAFASTSQSIERNAITADYYKSRLEALEKAGLNTTESQREYANIVSALNDLYPDLNLQIDEQSKLLNQNSKAQLSNLETLKKKALYKAQEERYTAALQAQADAILEVQDAERALVRTQGERQTIETQLNAITGKSIDVLIKLYNRQQMIDSAAQTNIESAAGLTSAFYLMQGSMDTLTPEQMEMVSQLIALTNEEDRLKTEIENGNAVISEQDANLQQLNETLQETSGEFSTVSAGQADATAAAQETAATVQTLRQEYDAAKEAARLSIDSQIGYFDEMKVESDTSAAQIVENWRNQQSALENYADNMQKAIDLGLDQALVQQLSDGSAQSMSILDALVNDTDISVDDINAAFEGVSKSRDTVSSVMADVQTDMSSRLDELSENIQSEWGEMSGTVGAEIANMQQYINSLTGNTVYVDVVTRYIAGGYNSAPYSTPSGYAAEPSTAYVLPQNIPYLAQGAVIPPNAPFYAVLGDQKNGTNVEAPLETIKQALAEVMGEYGMDVNVEFTGELAALARILAPVITREQRRNAIARGL